MLCDLLELDGWDTAYLGASVPIEALVSMVEKRRPDVVALSATITPHLPRLRAAIQAVRMADMPRQPTIIAGGRAISGDELLAKQLGADLTAKNAGDAVQLLRERVQNKATR
jgi:methanogenic corrinoid protein MtbC1